jgi:hypothetical protein
MKVERELVQNPTEITAHLEDKLGIPLQNKDSKNPNQVCGYVNTSGDGDVEVHTYQESELPDKRKQYKRLETPDLPQSEINKRVKEVLNPKRSPYFSIRGEDYERIFGGKQC